MPPRLLIQAARAKTSIAQIRRMLEFVRTDNCARKSAARFRLQPLVQAIVRVSAATGVARTYNPYGLAPQGAVFEEHIDAHCLSKRALIRVNFSADSDTFTRTPNAQPLHADAWLPHRHARRAALTSSTHTANQRVQLPFIGEHMAQSTTLCVLAMFGCLPQHALHCLAPSIPLTRLQCRPSVAADAAEMRAGVRDNQLNHWERTPV
jgi:hypothetical protein